MSSYIASASALAAMTLFMIVALCTATVQPQAADSHLAQTTAAVQANG